jgi:hypothetical protein
MKSRIAGCAALAPLILVGCGRPDASGIYLSASAHEVALVQLVQTKEGTITGRLEDVSVDGQGNVHDQTTNIDGAASGHDLMLKPASALLGGLNATGSFDGGGLSLTGDGFSLKAQRASLEKYQDARSNVEQLASTQRRHLAEERQKEADAAAQVQAATDAAQRNAALEAAAYQLNFDASKLSSAVAGAPNFTERAAANTARISKMIEIAPSLSAAQRNNLTVSANQVVVGTNHVEVARAQYAIGLDQIVQQARPLAEQVERFCSSPAGTQFSLPCAKATDAVNNLKNAVASGASTFGGYKQSVQDELKRQAAMIERMSGS